MDPSAPNNNNPVSPGSAPEPPPKPNVSATSIDPNDPLGGQLDTNAQNQSGPILPGQYVVAGGETLAEATPVVPADPVASISQPIPAFTPDIAQPSPDAAPDVAAAPALDPLPGGADAAVPSVAFAPLASDAYASAVPAVDLAANAQANPEGLGSPSLVSALPQASNSGQQPDPTPFAPPPPTSSPFPVSGGGSMITKLRLLAIVLGGLVLVGVLGGLAWFFLFNTKKPEVKTENTQSQAIEIEPSPLPKRTDGGFGLLPPIPQSTSSANQATSSAL